MPTQPIKLDLKKGTRYAWCSCGLTATPPFCDGSHKGTGKFSMPFKVEDDGEYFICDCKKTKNPPFCDGSHRE